jgi:hypothetical protein
MMLTSLSRPGGVALSKKRKAGKQRHRDSPSVPLCAFTSGVSFLCGGGDRSADR